MNSPTRRFGNQRPTFDTIGSYSSTRGDAAVSLFENYGVNFYDSQKFELRTFFARDDRGAFASRTICISKPRQNGKSYAARFYVLWAAAVEGQRCLYSAHHGKTVRKMFKQVCDFVTANDDFRRALKPRGGIYRAAGSEGIYFADESGRAAGFVEFQTRTNSASRGETYDIIVIDEAQELTDAQLEAIKPTTIAAASVDENRDPQMIFLGTPPSPACVGTVFKSYHDKAHSGTSGGIWWLEWAADSIPDPNDRAAIIEACYKTNPAMGYRIKESSMLDAFDGTRLDGFAREYLGYWSQSGGINTVLTAQEWTACDRKRAPQDGKIVFSVKFAPDNSHGAIAVCIKPQDGAPHIELVAVESTSAGIQYFADFIERRKNKFAAVVIDGGGLAQTLNDRVLAAGVPRPAIMRPGAADVANACSTLVAMIREKSVTHIDEPLLFDAATKTAKRTIGKNGGFGFASTKEGDAVVIEAAALALWGVLHTKRNPQRKAVIL